MAVSVHDEILPAADDARVSRRSLLKTSAAVSAGAALAPALSLFGGSVLGGALGGSVASAATAPVGNARAEAGAQLQPFPLNAVRLTASRWLDSQNRRLSYLKFLNMDRLLYNFRSVAKLSTNGATNAQGWEVQDWGIKGHSLGHYMSGAAMAVAQTGDSTLRNNLNYLVAELAKCQANAVAAGAHEGYLSGFPQSDFDRLESGVFLVPWYTLHKVMAGLLDTYRWLGNDQALTVLLNLADWVDWRTGRLSYSQMQNQLNTEFGGMNDILAELYLLTNNARWLTVAQRFDHAAIYDPLANNQDQLSGKHANTQLGKINGAIREYLATGTARYLTISRNFFAFVKNNHSYANGGNSVAEHFQQPNQISHRIEWNAIESCNVYNMLKLARDLFRIDPNSAEYMDYYERALMNQILAQQDPTSSHGRVTYYQDLRPGGSKVYDNDYNSFWCCSGTSMESFAKFNDSIYFESGSTLYVNLFIPSVLTWAQRGLTITQTTNFPSSNTTTLTVNGSGTMTMRIRIPQWASGASIKVNGTTQNVAVTPGTYATVSRTWANNDQVVVTLPMKIRLESAPDDPACQTAHYGPVLLAGSYGAATSPSINGNPVKGPINNTAVPGMPILDPATIASAGTLRFTAATSAGTANLKPYYDAHNENYNVYWISWNKSAYFELFNVGSGKVLGVTNMSKSDGATAVQWTDNGTADHEWEIVPAPGGFVRIRNRNSGKVLGLSNMSTAVGGTVVQWGDNGTADHDWTLVDVGNGYAKIRNRNSGLYLGISGGSTSDGAGAVQVADGASNDRLWRLTPVGLVRLRNQNSQRALGIDNMSGSNGARALQWFDSGTPDHAWTFVPASNGAFKIRNLHTGKVLGVSNESTALRASIVQWDDNGTNDHLWRLRPVADGQFRIQNVNSGHVIGIEGASKSAGAFALQSADNGAADHNWRIL
jgi:DUF1680 family protein